MAKYRKKPIVIDAEPYRPGIEDGFDCVALYSKIEHCPTGCNGCPEHKPYINTLEGKHYISDGDYVITGVKGERYPCKPDIFVMTYEPIE